MVAHVAELPRFRVAFVVRIVNRFGRPDPYMTVCFDLASWQDGDGVQLHTSTSCGKSFAVRGGMTAVNLEILLFACGTRTESALLANETRLVALMLLPLWLSQEGLMRCMLSRGCRRMWCIHVEEAIR